ncbi:MAG TPA: chromate efflux transporter [Actinomycetota bacterium]
MPPDADPKRGPLREVVLLFTRLGFTAFGGPAAHIALMHDEVVTRREWVGEQEFLDLIGATNMIPGPNSTELAIHLGRRRAGWRGLVLGGMCFIVPAMSIVLALAWAYVEYGATPEGEALLYGVYPVVIAVVAQALWSLGKTAVKDVPLALVGIAVLALYLAGVNEILLIFGTGLAVMLVRNAVPTAGWRVGLFVPWLFPASAVAAASQDAAESYPRLFLTFLKIGSVLFGSGYVLLAFLRADFVERLGWLTQQQVLDAVAIGQVTPGPVFTTATFIGYVVLGVPGALLATLGIFLPSFVFVAITAPIIPRLRRSRWLGAALDGVNVAALALMAGVTWRLALDAIVDVPTAAIGVLAAAILFLWKPNAVWLILAGGIAGLAIDALR